MVFKLQMLLLICILMSIFIIVPFFMLDPNLETTIDTTLGVTLLSFGYMNIDKKLSLL